MFFMMLDDAILHDIIPEGFGLPGTNGQDLDPFETISVGRRGAKQMSISLADPVWYDRAQLWCQALVTLLRF